MCNLKNILESRLQLLKDGRNQANPLMRDVIDLEIDDIENLLNNS